MKRTVLFIILFFSVLSINAQVMNNNGEKVIRKIEVYAESSLKPYAVMAFNYNNDLELEEIVVNIPLTCKFRLKKPTNVHFCLLSSIILYANKLSGKYSLLTNVQKSFTINPKAEKSHYY